MRIGLRAASERVPRYSRGVETHQDSILVQTRGRGTYVLTDEVGEIVERSAVDEGLATVFVHHTSASLLVCENADPEVRHDLERWLARAVPDGDRIFRHTAEGPDDMPAHVRAALTQASLVLPIRAGRLDLGTWQGIYLYEHRHAAHERRVSVTIIGA